MIFTSPNGMIHVGCDQCAKTSTVVKDLAELKELGWLGPKITAGFAGRTCCPACVPLLARWTADVTPTR